MNAPKVSEEQVIGVHTDPIFSHEELTSTPDACAARVVTSVYAAFGIPKDEIPREINLDTGFVRLPGS
jgi:hypothetical protein